MPQVLFTLGRPLACNADDAAPWVLIGPYGRHPTNDGRCVQVVTRAGVASMVAWFNSIGAKLKRVFGRESVPVFEGHPDFAPEVWKTRNEFGGVTALRASERGLEAQFALNDAARASIAKGRNLYPSSAWDCDPVEGTDHDIAPVLLWSVGLTDTPNIGSVDPVIAINANPATSDKETENETNTLTDIMKTLIGWLIKLALLKDADKDKPEAQEAAVAALMAKHDDMEAKLTAANNDKQKAEGDKAAAETATTTVNAKLSTAEASLATVNAKLTTAEADNAKLKKQLVTVAVNSLIESGRITKAEEVDTITALNGAADFDSAHKGLMAKKVAYPGQGLGLGRDQREAVTNAAAASTAINAWAQEHAAKYGGFTMAFNASKMEPSLKAHWDVLNTKET